MILERLEVSPADFERRTGWEIKPEGACKGDSCVPLPRPKGREFDVRVLAERLGLPLVEEPEAGIWALGPEPGRVLATAEAPDFTLPDWQGRPFTLSGLRGRKVVLLAWAPW